MKLPRLDTQKWAKRVRDPVWQFAGVVVALVALGVSVYVTYDVILRTDERPKLEGVISRKYPIIDVENEGLQDLEAYYLGQKAQVVSSFFFTIENTGKTAIRPEDYYSGPPVIFFEGSGEIAKVEVTDRQPGSIDLEVSQTSTRTIQLSEALLNPADKVELQVILVNEADPWTEPVLMQKSGRIANVADIEFKLGNDPTLLSFVRDGYFNFSIYVYVIIALVAAALLFGTLLLVRHKAPQQWLGAFVEMKIVTMAVMSVIMVFWIYGLSFFIGEGSTNRWWRFWMPAAVLVGLLVMVYVLWIMGMIWKGVSSKSANQGN